MQQDSLSSQQSQQSPRRSKEVRSKQNGKDKAVSPLAKQKAMPKVSETQEEIAQLYKNDRDIENLLKTKQAQLEKIQTRCTDDELLYDPQNEEAHNQERENINDKIGNLVRRTAVFKTEQDGLIDKNVALKEKLQSLREQLAQEQVKRFQEWTEYEKTLAEKNTNTKKLTQEQLHLLTRQLELNAKIKIQNDLEEELTRETERLAAINEQKKEVQNELGEASENINGCEERLKQTSLRSLELLKNLRDCEEEIESLKFYICDLKGRIAVYIPVKGDSTDKKLAEYINNYPERSKLKIMFMRESSGVYQFGTKRVNVKVAKDKIEIRVGGGYLSIDEFLDQYTPAELEKLERKDPMRRMNERIAVQKIAASSKAIRESSPIRGTSPGLRKSPTRPSSRPSTSGTGRSSVGRAGGAKKIKV